MIWHQGCFPGNNVPELMYHFTALARVQRCTIANERSCQTTANHHPSHPKTQTDSQTPTQRKKIHVFSIRTVREKHKVLQQRISVRCLQASREKNKKTATWKPWSDFFLSAKTTTSTTTDAKLGTCINKVNAVTWVSAALQSGTGLVGRNNYGWWQSWIFCSHFEH